MLKETSLPLGVFFHHHQQTIHQLMYTDALRLLQNINLQVQFPRLSLTSEGLCHVMGWMGKCWFILYSSGGEVEGTLWATDSTWHGQTKKYRNEAWPDPPPVGLSHPLEVVRKWREGSRRESQTWKIKAQDHHIPNMFSPSLSSPWNKKCLGLGT